MTKPLASPTATAVPMEHDPELAAIAARPSEMALYAVNPSFKEELRKTLLHEFEDRFATEQATTETSECQAAEVHEQAQRDTLILAYLRHVDALLRKFARSTHLEYEDLRQDACLVIMHCLDLKPEQKHTLHRSISTSVRRRMLDKIRYTYPVESLDAPLGNGSERDGEETLAISLPSGSSIDPMLVVLAWEERREARIQAKTAMQKLSTRQRKTKRVQKALALFQEEVAGR